MEGLAKVSSTFGPRETMDRLESELRARNVTVFARVDHAAGAAAVGLTLLPTELLIFGSARTGTPLMQANQTVSIDLPLKALVWQDAAGQTWLGYIEPSWVAARHGLGDTVKTTTAAMTTLLAAVARVATGTAE